MSADFSNFKWYDGTSTPTRVQVFSQKDYIHTGDESSGEIRRTFYCQPFTANKSLLVALRGGFNEEVDGTLTRIKPHNDPIYPRYYCVGHIVEPIAPQAVSGSPYSGFTPSTGNTVQEDITGLRKALDTLPANFDNDSNLDTLTLPEIVAGNANYPAGFTNSKGDCGAWITAIYKPLIFPYNLSSSIDPFDAVDPQIHPYTKVETLGRSLEFIINDLNLPAPSDKVAPFGGVADSAVVAETCLNYTIRRLMVPFYPMNTVAILNNRINSALYSVGNQIFPPGTMKIQCPDAEEKITIDGRPYWDLTLNFQVRLNHNAYWDNPTSTTKTGWLDWNYFLGVPSVAGIQWLGSIFSGKKTSLGYYPVGWFDGLFNIFGSYRYLYLKDNLTDYAGRAGASPKASIMDLFSAGKKPDPLQGI